MTTAIIGYGWVGKAMHTLFPDAVVYDRYVEPSASQARVNECDVAFVGVPTPNKKWIADRIIFTDGSLPKTSGEGELDTSIVEEVIKWCECPLIVIRSTVNPGDCDRWSRLYGKHIIMQPEYLGETVNHPMTEQKERPFLVIGGEPEDRKKLIDLYTTAYNANIRIRQVSLMEAEVIKLSENRAISYKVAQCQELYDVCQLANVDYYSVRDAVYGDDPRFNLWWTFVFPEKRGFNSKCIPKDVYAWCAWAESLGYEPRITRELLEKNKEWLALVSNTTQAKPTCKHKFEQQVGSFTERCINCGLTNAEENHRSVESI